MNLLALAACPPELVAGLVLSNRACQSSWHGCPAATDLCSVLSMSWLVRLAR